MNQPPAPATGFTQRALATVERVGNKLPDPAVLFIALLFIVWALSWLLSYGDYGVIDPRTGEPLVVVNQLSGTSLTAFFSAMVKNFAQRFCTFWRAVNEQDAVGIDTGFYPERV